MPGVSTRVLEKTLSHLAATLEQAEQARFSSLAIKPIHRIDARVKVVGAILITVAAVSCRHLLPVFILLALLTLAALFSKITWKRILAAWASGVFFGALVAVPAIFTSGWNTALLLIARSEASLTCWLLVVMTTRFDRVLRALRTLHVPVVFVAILSMTFRYIFLLVETALDMLLSRRSRIVGRLSGADNRRLLVSTTGVLLGKTIQMSDDVYQAMTSRGFRGDIHILDDLKMATRDWLALVAIIAIAVTVFLGGR